jgi:hypothetical protein
LQCFHHAPFRRSRRSLARNSTAAHAFR